MSQNIRLYLAEKLSENIFIMHFPVSTITVKAVELLITIILPTYCQLVPVFEIFTEGKRKEAPRIFVAEEILLPCQQVIMPVTSLFLDSFK